MRKLTYILILLALPLIIFANNSYFGMHQLKGGQNPLMQNDRAYRVIQHTIQAWGYTSNVWNDESNFEYYYTPNNTANPDSVVAYIWDSGTNSFRKTGVYHITYDIAGEHITHMTFSNTYASIEYLYADFAFDYTAGGDLVGFTISNPGDNGDLEPNQKMSIEYTSTSDYESWNWTSYNEDGVPQWNHSTFQWDTNGRITQETIEISLDSLNWVNDEKITHEYIAGDNTTADIFVSNFSHQMPLAMIGVYNGPNYGKQSQSLTQSWNNNQWVNRYKEVFTYTADNVITNVTESKWQGGNWVNNGKNDYLYDSNANLIDDTYSIWVSNAWKNDTRSLYNWSTYTANSDNTIIPQVFSLNAYPNPFNPLTTISYKLEKASSVSIKIYNLKGEAIRTVLTTSQAKGNHNTEWDGTDDWGKNVSNGVYYIKLESDNKTAIRKVTLIK